MKQEEIKNRARQSFVQRQPANYLHLQNGMNAEEYGKEADSIKGLENCTSIMNGEEQNHHVPSQFIANNPCIN